MKKGFEDQRIEEDEVRDAIKFARKQKNNQRRTRSDILLSVNGEASDRF